MFKFAIKNLLIKKIQVILIIFSIMISAGVGVLAYNVSNQVSDGLTSNAAYYSLIVGPSGSSTQLAMNSMYFTDEPLGTIPYSVKIDLEKDSRVKSVIPFAMADNYNGYKIVGTTGKYLDGKKMLKGEMFDDQTTFEVVVGYNVAKTCSLKIGEQIFTSHSLGEEHHTPFVVKGILSQSFSSFDNIVFTQLRSIWEVHEEEEEEEEEHDHEEMENMVCALLVNTTNPLTAMQLQNEYNGKLVPGEDKTYTLQAIEPMSVMRNVLEDTDQTKYIVYALAGIILLMNILIIVIITLLNMYQSQKDIKLMRLIGVSMKKINLLYLIQNTLIGLISVVLALVVSRIGLIAMGGYAASMGVVLNVGKIYPPEFLVLLLIFIVNVLPTLICTNIMSKKDGLD